MNEEEPKTLTDVIIADAERIQSKAEMRGLRAIVKALDSMTPRSRYAAIRWLADVYQIRDGQPRSLDAVGQR